MPDCGLSQLRRPGVWAQLIITSRTPTDEVAWSLHMSYRDHRVHYLSTDLDEVVRMAVKHLDDNDVTPARKVRIIRKAKP